MFTLYHHGSSVCAAKVRFLMAEKGLKWDGVYIDILKGEQFTPDYMKLNPKAVVPTLVHDERVITESTVICEYLDRTYPDTSLHPDDPWDYAQVRKCKLEQVTSRLASPCNDYDVTTIGWKGL